LVPVPAAILALLQTHADLQAEERLRAGQLWIDQGWSFADETGLPAEDFSLLRATAVTLVAAAFGAAGAALFRRRDLRS
jgi:hypothetical protein